MPDTDTRLSMAEQLSATYDKLAEEKPDDTSEVAADTDANPAQEGTSESGQADRPDRARDEAGRFAKEKAEKRETLTLKPKETKDAAPQPERPEAGKEAGKEVAPEGKDKPQGEVIQPPANWSGKAKVEFNRLPYHVKQELVGEMNRAGESVAKLSPMAPVLQPYEERFQREFGGTDRALANILGAWKHARSEPIDFTAQFAQTYGNGSPIDFLRNVAQRLGLDPQSIGAASGTQPQGEGLPQYVTREELAAIQQQQAADYQRRQAEAFQTQIMSEVAEMRADAANFPYFNDVREHMVGLIQSPAMSAMIKEKGGKAALKEAYDQAVWANPSTRNALIETQQREAAAKIAADRKAAADKARYAGGSVTGSPGVARGEVHVNQSVRADLASNWEKLEARV